MKFAEKTVYTMDLDPMTVMVIKGKEAWEIYYRKPQFTYEFAFGLPLTEELNTVLQLAEDNAEDYDDLFEEVEP